MRISRIKKAFLVFLIALIGLLLLTFIIINLPFSRSFLTQKVNSIFISSRLPVQIGSVTKIFPGSVSVEEVIISGRGGDTIVFAGSVQAGFKTLSLLKKRLILTSVELEKARIRFIRNNEREQLNIVDAFSNEDIAATSVNPVEEDNQNSPWEISVREAGISDLRFRMVDSVGGIFINQDVKRIRVEAKKMSLTEKIIIARSLEVEGLTGSITLKMSTERDTTDSELPWNIGLEELNAGNINFVFDDPVNKLKLDLLAGEIKIKAGGTDINKNKIDFTKVSFSHTSIALHTDNPSTSPANDEIKSSAVFPWTIRGDAINLEEVSVSMAKYSDTADYNPLSGFSVLGLNMSLSGIRIDSAVVNAELQTMKFDLGNSFSIREMTGSIASHSGNTRIDLSVKSANSKLNIIGSAAGNLFEILDDPASTGKASESKRNKYFRN
ncbi:MAG: hypothetical protein IPJ37_11300 [Bacteroidales bacterium]|nr:hypothetical protein [Bacteroidales bacterium]